VNPEDCWACARELPTTDKPSGEIALCPTHWGWWIMRWLWTDEIPPADAHVIDNAGGY